MIIVLKINTDGNVTEKDFDGRYSKTVLPTTPQDGRKTSGRMTGGQYIKSKLKCSVIRYVVNVFLVFSFLLIIQ